MFVTSLDAARPAGGADIRISDWCDGKLLWSGRTGADGIARVDSALPGGREYGSCYGLTGHPLMVSARAAGDLSFTLSKWNNGIGPDDFHLPGDEGNESGPIAHTVLDRSLFRAGETVSMKHFLREHAGTGLKLPDRYPQQVVLQQEGSEQTYSFPLAWNIQGSADTVWQIPKDAKLGRYDISLKFADDKGTLNSGWFRVEQYKVPSMRAILQGPKDPLVNADHAAVDVFVSYMSGGGAAYLPVKLRTQVQSRELSFPGYDDFHFGGDEIKPGITASGHGACADCEDEADADSSGDSAQPAAGPARLIPLALDGQGAVRATVPKLPKLTAPAQLAAELDYQDANGETLSTSATIPLWPAAMSNT